MNNKNNGQPEQDNGKSKEQREMAAQRFAELFWRQYQAEHEGEPDPNTFDRPQDKNVESNHEIKKHHS